MLPRMGDSVTRLTKRIVDGATPADKDYFIWDDDLSGFGLRVMRSGRRSYVIQYRSGGRTRRLTFAKHGVMTPDEARKMARELLVDVAKGGNPSETKRLARQAPTVKELCDRFLSEHAETRCKTTTLKDYRFFTDKVIVPRFGKMKVLDVTRKDVADLHHSLKETPYKANRMLAVLSKMFNLAELWGTRPDGSNPTRHVRKYAEQKRERYLSMEELTRLGDVLQQCEDEGTENEYLMAALRLLILTGCRLGEIQTLKWEYVQGNRLILPDSKSGAKKVYLGQAALEILASIDRVDGNPYVIVGKKEGQFLVGFQRAWRRIRNRAGLVDLRIHDLRHSFASAAVANGEGLPVIGKLLGHSQVQTTARYAHLADDPVQASAERVSSAIADGLLGKDRNVT